MNRLLPQSLETEELLPHCQGGKMLISGYVQLVLWKNKQLSFLKLLIRTPGGECVGLHSRKP